MMMETEAKDTLGSLNDSVERLTSAASLLERTVAWLEAREAAVAGEVQKVVAAVEPTNESSSAEEELERKLRAADQEIAELRAQAAKPAMGRKTLASDTTQLLAKHGGAGAEQIEAATLDAALAGLSLEQRIAVKSQLMRAGALV
jgi:predicted RNase H-like nuclease (RuvC/YqgF family)